MACEAAAVAKAAEEEARQAAEATAAAAQAFEDEQERIEAERIAKEKAAAAAKEAAELVAREEAEAARLRQRHKEEAAAAAAEAARQRAEAEALRLVKEKEERDVAEAAARAKAEAEEQAAAAAATLAEQQAADAAGRVADEQAKPAAAVHKLDHNAIKPELTDAGKAELLRLQQRYCKPTKTDIAPDSPFFAHGSDEQQAVVRPPAIDKYPRIKARLRRLNKHKLQKLMLLRRLVAWETDGVLRGDAAPLSAAGDCSVASDAAVIVLNSSEEEELKEQRSWLAIDIDAHAAENWDVLFVGVKVEKGLAVQPATTRAAGKRGAGGAGYPRVKSEPRDGASGT